MANTLALPMDEAPAPSEIQAQTSPKGIKPRFSKAWQKMMPKKTEKQPMHVPEELKTELQQKIEKLKAGRQTYDQLKKDYDDAYKKFQEHYIEVDKLKTKKSRLMDVMRKTMDEHDIARIAKIDEDIASIRQNANTELKEAVNTAFKALEEQRQLVQPLEKDLLEFVKKPELRQETLRPEFKEATASRVEKTPQTNFGRNFRTKLHGIGQSLIRPF
jgi:chromosome segregation ATPase